VTLKRTMVTSKPNILRTKSFNANKDGWNAAGI